MAALTISLTPRRLLCILSSAIAVLVVLHGVMVVALYGFGDPDFLKLRAMFDLNREQNVPTLFSTLQLALASVLLIVVCTEARSSRRSDAFYWAGLALVFAFLAADEFCELHERLIAPLRQSLQVSGALSFAWVIPYACLVVLFAAGYARFWWRLSPEVRTLFAAAGVTYVAGGIGMEMVGSKLFTLYGWESVQFDTETMVEEAMEMSGVALFIYAIMKQLQERLSSVTILFRGQPDSSLLADTIRANALEELADDARECVRDVA